MPAAERFHGMMIVHEFEAPVTADELREHEAYFRDDWPRLVDSCGGTPVGPPEVTRVINPRFGEVYTLDNGLAVADTARWFIMGYGWATRNGGE